MVVCDRLSLVSIIMMATIAGIAEKEKFNNHMETTLQRSQRQ